MTKSDLVVEAVITNIYQGGLFKCEFGNGSSALAKVCGKMALNKIKVIIGDRVLLSLSPYDLTRGRITFRFK
jgi:translation initiation factor IF-1